MKFWAYSALLAGLIALSSSPAQSASLPDPSARCLAAGQAAARASGTPPDLMTAITLVETGRRHEGETVSWPWTINIAGKGYWFASKREAISFVRRAQKQGAKSIDVGCYQINLRWHPEAFRSLEEAFDPAANARYAAQFLKALKTPETKWITAAGAYHSGNEEFAALYRRRVRSALGSGLTIRPEGPLLAVRRSAGGIELAWYAQAPGKSLLRRASSPLFRISTTGNRP